MKILGVDVGKRRIGLAVSDEGGRFAFPLDVIEVEREEAVVDKIREVGEKEGAEVIVIGIPYSLKGRITQSTEFALLVAHKLREIGFKVEEIDERLTTREAERMVETKRRKGKADKIVAALLLQVYLQRRKQ